MIIRSFWKVFIVLSFTQFSYAKITDSESRDNNGHSSNLKGSYNNDCTIFKSDLSLCKEKLTEEQKLHRNDKSRLKLHLKNTRHNIQVYKRMVQVMVKII